MMKRDLEERYIRSARKLLGTGKSTLFGETNVLKSMFTESQEPRSPAPHLKPPGQGSHSQPGCQAALKCPSLNTAFAKKKRGGRGFRLLREGYAGPPSPGKSQDWKEEPGEASKHDQAEDPTWKPAEPIVGGERQGEGRGLTGSLQAGFNLSTIGGTRGHGGRRAPAAVWRGPTGKPRATCRGAAPCSRSRSSRVPGSPQTDPPLRQPLARPWPVSPPTSRSGTSR
ncbi:uncharacterized protein LOC117073293 isoform X1 [Trachypithecus francoisi]|uniref:uncharacterized protein LOC117073293 isoform X1 n=1 Tax=Trachypithecus francoisi TaxID=54180 RepID=UPI00141B8B11|nr:uncharacterized protein LOC117073293 isoform X1 [Trachypithecus francoisi]